MKHIFVINPAAGKGGRPLHLLPQIKALADRLQLAYQLHLTTSSGEAIDFTRACCQQNQGLDLRFYAVGGDGTLNEVVSGAVGCQNAQIACLPTGSGNDFIRNFPQAAFNDLTAQINGTAHLTDLIQIDEQAKDGQVKTYYTVNIAHIGFDTAVVAKAAELKTRPLITGSAAYLLSVFYNLINKSGENLRICADGQILHNGPLLLAAAANGGFYGGGLPGAPLAAVDDGLLDLCLIKDTSRSKFVSLLPSYLKGRHLQNKRAQQIIIYRQCRELTITPNNGTALLCRDGETTAVGGLLSVRLLPKALRFVVPQGKAQK
ncbi:MAG: diacylglycerol kinase family protein [Clostridia bacterium]|nr:diacylglycerol kinase family protein [Clostridia bacterium]